MALSTIATFWIGDDDRRIGKSLAQNDRAVDEAVNERQQRPGMLLN
jgi:hypothetical protein